MADKKPRKVNYTYETSQGKANHRVSIPKANVKRVKPKYAYVIRPSIFRSRKMNIAAAVGLIVTMGIMIILERLG